MRRWLFSTTGFFLYTPRKQADRLFYFISILYRYWDLHEMNPIEIIWREIRSRGFKNILFDSLQAVVDKFYEVVDTFSRAEVISITRWTWIDNILREVV